MHTLVHTLVHILMHTLVRAYPGAYPDAFHIEELVDHEIHTPATGVHQNYVRYISKVAQGSHL